MWPPWWWGAARSQTQLTEGERDLEWDVKCEHNYWRCHDFPHSLLPRQQLCSLLDLCTASQKSLCRLGKPSPGVFACVCLAWLSPHVGVFPCTWLVSGLVCPVAWRGIAIKTLICSITWSQCNAGWGRAQVLWWPSEREPMWKWNRAGRVWSIFF